jgi:flagellar biosynthesis anti-sigma factor FlgM
MRITDRYQSLMDRVPAGAARPTDKTDKGGRSAATSSAAQSATVKVSERAQQLASGAARVEQLRAAVRDGTFRIDADAIAARLVGDE